MDQWFRQAGEFNKNEALSKDFYEAAMIWLHSIQEYKTPGLIKSAEGFYVNKFQKMVFEIGIVKEDQFKFPIIDGKSIRTSDVLHDQFYAKLNEAKTKKDDGLFKSTLEMYLGKIGEVHAYAPSPEFIKDFAEITYNREILKTTPIVKVESEIIQSLDKGVPVSFGIGGFGTRLHTAKRTGHIFSGLPNPILDGNFGHGMNIIGYHLNKLGKVDWYLIENSWGEAFGAKGTASISAAYLYRQTHSYAIPIVK